MKTKKEPLRQCIGCMEMKTKKELIRVVKSPEGEVSLDLLGKKNGRGAYLCRNKNCLAKAVKTKKLSRTFGIEIPNELVLSLEKEMESVE